MPRGFLIKDQNFRERFQRLMDDAGISSPESLAQIARDRGETLSSKTPRRLLTIPGYKATRHSVGVIARTLGVSFNYFVYGTEESPIDADSLPACEDYAASPSESPTSPLQHTERPGRSGGLLEPKTATVADIDPTSPTSSENGGSEQQAQHDVPPKPVSPRLPRNRRWLAVVAAISLVLIVLIIGRGGGYLNEWLESVHVYRVRTVTPEEMKRFDAAPSARIVIGGVTTSSRAAYQEYEAGMQFLRRLYRDEAAAAFHRALELDPDFAMARMMLVHPDLNASDRRRTSEEALRLSSTATEAEQQLIHAYHAWYHDEPWSEVIRRFEIFRTQQPSEHPLYQQVLRQLGGLYFSCGDYANSVARYRAAVALAPEDGMSWNRLAYVYRELGQIENALDAVDRYQAVALGEPNPYDTRGDILSRAGRVEEAKRSYRHALNLKPDFFPSLQSLGTLCALTGEFDSAGQYFKRLGTVKNPGAQARSAFLRAALRLYQGDLDTGFEALDTAEAVIAAQPISGDYLDEVYMLRAIALQETGHVKEAVVEYERMLARRTPQTYWRGEVIATYIDAVAQVDTPRARGILEDYRDYVEGSGADIWERYWTAKGSVDLAAGDVDAAIDALEHGLDSRRLFYTRYVYARALLEAGHCKEASEQIDAALKDYNTQQLMFVGWGVKAHYVAARAFECLGNRDEACAEYERFLTLWGRVDIPEVAWALGRLDAVAAGSR